MLNVKKSARWRFFLLCLFCFSSTGLVHASNQNCISRPYSKSATVEYTHDGDTIRLTDGRKIRLIGINAPEVARDEQPAETYALQARDRLRNLLHKHGNQIKLIYGKEKQDHYQRSLAHIFLPDGRNLQAQLLSEGLVTAITIPPNDRYAECYQQTEKQALCEKKGVWSLKTPNIKELDDSASGFRLLRGKLINIKSSQKDSWLEMEHGLSLKIDLRHKHLFNMKRLESLIGHTVIIRGWLQIMKKPGQDERFYMRLKHPSSIEEAKKAMKC